MCISGGNNLWQGIAMVKEYREKTEDLEEYEDEEENYGINREKGKETDGKEELLEWGRVIKLIEKCFASIRKSYLSNNNSHF